MGEAQRPVETGVQRVARVRADLSGHAGLGVVARAGAHDRLIHHCLQRGEALEEGPQDAHHRQCLIVRELRDGDAVQHVVHEGHRKQLACLI